MKIIALHNKRGQILAAVHLTPNYKGPRPVASKDTSVAELDVPQQHAAIGLVEICKRLQVDIKSNKLTERRTSKRPSLKT